MFSRVYSLHALQIHRNVEHTPHLCVGNETKICHLHNGDLINLYQYPRTCWRYILITCPQYRLQNLKSCSSVPGYFLYLSLLQSAEDGGGVFPSTAITQKIRPVTQLLIGWITYSLMTYGRAGPSFLRFNSVLSDL